MTSSRTSGVDLAAMPLVVSSRSMMCECWWDQPSSRTRPGRPEGHKAGRGSRSRPARCDDFPNRNNPHPPMTIGESGHCFGTWTDRERKEFRAHHPKPPGRGKIVDIDPELREIDVTGMGLTTDVGLGWFSRLYNVLEYRCITPKTRPGIVPVEMPRT